MGNNLFIYFYSQNQNYTMKFAVAVLLGLAYASEEKPKS